MVKVENNAETKYVYGLGLIGEEVSGNFKTYHFDYRGSTVAITNASGNVTDTFEYDTYGKLKDRTGTTKTPFLYNGRDGVMYEDDTGLYYMRARYYSPAIRRFVNADKVHGDISNALTLNRYSFCNGDPAVNVDPLGLSAERVGVGTAWGGIAAAQNAAFITYNYHRYNRDAAIEYARKYYNGWNRKYMKMDDDDFRLEYFLLYGKRSGYDCANFVSQCLAAGNVKQTDEWYYYKENNTPIQTIVSTIAPPVTLFYINSDWSITHRPYEYEFTSAWTGANAQYKYFSDKSNGYINGEVITINSVDDIPEAISNNNIQKGDLLYWSNDGENAYHATIINDITNDGDIRYAAHTSPIYDASLSKKIEKSPDKTVFIVRMNDYLN